MIQEDQQEMANGLRKWRQTEARTDKPPKSNWVHRWRRVSDRTGVFSAVLDVIISGSFGGDGERGASGRDLTREKRANRSWIGSPSALE